MKQILVQINGKTRVAKLERAESVSVRGCGSRREREKYKQGIVRNYWAYRVTIGKERRFIVLTNLAVDSAERGSKGAKKVIVDAIVREFLSAAGNP